MVKNAIARMNGSYKMAILEELLWTKLGEVSPTNWQVQRGHWQRSFFVYLEEEWGETE